MKIENCASGSSFLIHAILNSSECAVCQPSVFIYDYKRDYSDCKRDYYNCVFSAFCCFFSIVNNSIPIENETTELEIVNNSIPNSDCTIFLIHDSSAPLSICPFPDQLLG